jgi:hypothetical protein
MIEIKRDRDGNHTIAGKPLVLIGFASYRKIVPIIAVRVTEPFSVETLEGTMQGKAGDWLIIGAHGEMYPCDDSIFRDTYELVE